MNIESLTYYFSHIQVPNFLVIGCEVFLLVVVIYSVFALMYAKNNIGEFYFTLKINRFAFVVKGGVVTKVIYNIPGVKLIKDNNCPIGKFVPISEPGKELQKLGPIEKLFGIYFVGIPGFHSILEKKLTWSTFDGSEFTEHKDEVVNSFAYTKTFGFDLEGLTLGGDKNNTLENGDRDGQKLQRIDVDIKMLLQGTIVYPYKAIFLTNWITGTKGKLMRIVQSFLGKASQDELIDQEGNDCDLVKEIKNNITAIEVYGVKFDPDKITYVDYSLSGDKDEIAAIKKADNENYIATQEAAGTKRRQRAEQEGMVAQREVVVSMAKDLKAEGFDTDHIAMMTASMFRSRGLESLRHTGLTTFVEGGAAATLAISANGGSKKTDKDNTVKKDKNRGAKK